MCNGLLIEAANISVLYCLWLLTDTELNECEEYIVDAEHLGAMYEVTKSTTYIPTKDRFGIYKFAYPIREFKNGKISFHTLEDKNEL